ncbi:MAG: hypothetical protein KJ052_06665 [Candidatus Hydrogenedentes bacterium]|nr:hypothetical protein [Candidatus Hydrogenedentota bacterium]
MRPLLSVMVCLLTALLFAGDAVAWGPRARQAIATTALQLVRSHYSPAPMSRAGMNNVKDIVNGSESGRTLLYQGQIVRTEDDVLRIIGSEIQLLRAVRAKGGSPYFAYRMGALSALVADWYLPYALNLETSDEAHRLKRMIEDDIDERLKQFSFEPKRNNLVFVRYPQDYFNEARQFFEEARRIIASDYASGLGYEGYIKDGSRSYFERSSLAVADVWHTILQEKADVYDSPPSAEALTWYYVSAIDYLLNVKKDEGLVRDAYRKFVDVNPGIPDTYEKVGDFYYETGKPQRAVEEWKIASRLGGMNRKRVQTKISNYYVEVGQNHLKTAEMPEAPESALGDAIEAFTLALEIDPTNQNAAALHSETRVAIEKLEKQRDLMIQMVANAETAKQHARQSREARAYSDALTTLQNAILLAENVDKRFKTQYDSAQELILDAQAEIKEILSQILDDANAQIDEAQALADSKQFDDAMFALGQIEAVLVDIPESFETDYREEKQKIIDQAAQKAIEFERLKQAEAERKALEAQAAAAAPPG